MKAKKVFLEDAFISYAYFLQMYPTRRQMLLKEIALSANLLRECEGCPFLDKSEPECYEQRRTFGCENIAR
jgi:hypothetical protein